MADPLVIHTCCSRPQNLPYLVQSLHYFPELLNVRWDISIDSNRVSRMEWEQKILDITSTIDNIPVFVTFEEHEHIEYPEYILRNRELERLFSGFPGFYFYTLDDDNILHPAFFPVIGHYIQNKPNKAYVFATIFQRENGPYPWIDSYLVRVPDPAFVRPTQIDIAQYVVHSSVIGDVRFLIRDGCADGVFIETLFNNKPTEFVFVPQILAYYNSLNPMKPWVPPLEIGF